MPYAPLPDGRLYYEAHGDEGSPVLLVMGLAMRGVAWRFQTEALARKHRVAWFDGRGVGLTEAPTGRLTLQRMARDSVALMDHLDWDRAHVVGVSMGGMIAQHLALEHGQRVTSLSLLATHPGGPRHLLPPPRGLRRFLLAQLTPGRRRLDHLERLLYTRDYLEQTDREALRSELLRGLGARRPLGDVIAQVRAVMQHDTRTRLRALASLPTLVVKPEGDCLIAPRASDIIHRLVPGSTLVSVPGGHGFTRERAAEVNDALLRHLEAADRPVGGAACAGNGRRPGDLRRP